MTRKSTGDDHEGSQFGIPSAPGTILGEEPAVRAKRVAAIHKLVADVFAIAEKHLGAEEARSLWTSVVPPMKRGPKRRTRNPKRDALLLDIYDFTLRESGLPPEAVPGHLGRRFAGKSFGLYTDWKSQDAATIEKMIRRLVQRRTKARSALNGVEPTLLGSAAGQEFPNK